MFDQQLLRWRIDGGKPQFIQDFALSSPHPGLFGSFCVIMTKQVENAMHNE